MPKTLNTKNRILSISSQVFYKDGYHATGVESIAVKAGITKATLYHHFKNKDELIEESLKHLSEFHRNNYNAAWGKKGLSPKEKLTILFDEMHRSFKEPDFYGCPFINVSGEYFDRNSNVRQIAKSHYNYVINNLEQFAVEAGLNKPRQVAEHITSCIVGAYSAWFVCGIPNAAKQAKKVAELVIENSAHSLTSTRRQ